jgi:hypothetical protein
MRAIDGDSHFIEPLDLFERYIDSGYRDRTVRVGIDSSGRVIGRIVDNRPMRMADLDELMSACAGYGEKEKGRSISDFDLYRIASQKWQDMDLRVGYLDQEVQGSYAALQPLIAEYSPDSTGVYFPFPRPQASPPAEDSGKSALMVMEFNRAGLASAAARVARRKLSRCSRPR